MRLINIIGLISFIKLAYAECGTANAQCGGLNFTGDDCCISGYTCKYINESYSQCVEDGNTLNSTSSNETTKKTSTKKTTSKKSTTKKSTTKKSTTKKSTTKKSTTKKTTKTTTSNTKTTKTKSYSPLSSQPYCLSNHYLSPSSSLSNSTSSSDSSSSSESPSSSQSTSSSKPSSSSSLTTDVVFPTAKKTIIFNEPYVIKAGEVFDGLAVNGVWTSYGRGVTGHGDCKNVEGGSKDAVFRLESGATLKNVIIGADSIEHVHCIGDGCTVENVWWDDVCEDALTLKGSTNKNAKFYLIGGGARDGSDKIVQHNSAGTVYIKGFYCSNSGKLYRACGNCKSGYQDIRHVIIEDVTTLNVGVLAGINTNYGDTATFINVNANGGNVCNTYTGNNNGKEPPKTGSQCKNQSNCVCK
jgi:hypothetical protein